MGIPQTRILEWVAVPSSRGSSRLRDQTRILHLLHWHAGSLPVAPPESPMEDSYLQQMEDKPKQFLQTCGAICLFEWQVTVYRCWLGSIGAFFHKSSLQARQHIRKQRHYFADKRPYNQAMVFPMIMYGCESWTIKKAKC